MILIALILPWLSFLLRGKFFAGVVCLILQLTLIGWLPAAIWAVVAYNNAKADKRAEQIANAVRNTQ